MTSEQMHPLKFSYDVLGEECLQILNQLPSPPSEAGSGGESKPSGSPFKHQDFYSLLRDNHASHPKLEELWNEVNTVPEWVDWNQLSRGQDVFYRYGGACLMGLAFQSLLGGMGAGRVVETLSRTGGFSTKVSRRRLFETTQHVLQVTSSLNSIKPGGDGWASTIRVRLLHAVVRQRIMKLQKDRPGYYNVEKWGIPINDLDSIATITTFSSSLIWISLPRQGLFLKRTEIQDFLALWRYVAYVIGCPTEVFATPESARRIAESLHLYEIVPTETSRILANNVVASLAYTPPFHTSPDLLIATARWLNGHDLCDALGLARPSAYWYLLMVGQCLFFMTAGYSYGYSSKLDRRRLAWIRVALWAMIVESKTGLDGNQTKFEFKHIPSYGKITLLEGAEPLLNAASIGGMEKRALRTLAYAFILLSLMFCLSLGAFWTFISR
jgi:hypothetical protein